METNLLISSYSTANQLSSFHMTKTFAFNGFRDINTSFASGVVTSTTLAIVSISSTSIEGSYRLVFSWLHFPFSKKVTAVFFVTGCIYSKKGLKTFRFKDKEHVLMAASVCFVLNFNLINLRLESGGVL